MKSFADSLANRSITQEKPKNGITNQRQELVKMFLDRLNASRMGQVHPVTKKPLKPLTAAFVASRMRWWKTNQDLREFYGYCNEGKNFSSTWWYKTDPKNYEPESKV